MSTLFSRKVWTAENHNNVILADLIQTTFSDGLKCNSNHISTDFSVASIATHSDDVKPRENLSEDNTENNSVKEGCLKQTVRLTAHIFHRVTSVYSGYVVTIATHGNN